MAIPKKVMKEENNSKMKESMKERLAKAAKNGKRAVIAVTAGGGTVKQYGVRRSGRHRRHF